MFEGQIEDYRARNQPFLIWHGADGFKGVESHGILAIGPYSTPKERIRTSRTIKGHTYWMHPNKDLKGTTKASVVRRALKRLPYLRIQIWFGKKPNPVLREEFENEFSELEELIYD